MRSRGRREQRAADWDGAGEKRREGRHALGQRREGKERVGGKEGWAFGPNERGEVFIFFFFFSKSFSISKFFFFS